MKISKDNEVANKQTFKWYIKTTQCFRFFHHVKKNHKNCKNNRTLKPGDESNDIS